MKAKSVFLTVAAAAGLLLLAGAAALALRRQCLRLDFATLSREEEAVTNGVTLVRFVSRAKPCRAYLVKIDLRAAGLAFCVEQGEHRLATRATVARMAEVLERRTGRRPFVGLNGDLFNIKFDSGVRGNPVGVSVADGRFFTSGWRHAVDAYESLCTFEDGGTPEIARLTFRGTVVGEDGTRLALDAYNAGPFRQGETRKARLVYYDAAWTAPLPEEGVLLALDPARPGRAAVAGRAAKGTVLPADGRHAALVGFNVRRVDADRLRGTVAIDLSLTDGRGRTPRNAVRIWTRPLVAGAKRPTERGLRNNYPRSLFGLGKDLFVLFVVDGRKPFYSESLLAEDAAEILRREGCTEAGEMDGGGSATLWLDGDYVNDPSDLHARKVSNGIFFAYGP